MDVNMNDFPSPSDSLLHQISPVKLSKHASLSLRITLSLLGLWQPDAEVKASQVHRAAGGAVNDDDGYNSMLTLPKQNIQQDDRLTCDTCVIDISRIPLCQMKANKSRRTSTDRGTALKVTLTHIVAFSYLLAIIVIMTYDLSYYLADQWGKSYDLLHLVSYLTFLFQVMAVPVTCLFARLRSLVIFSPTSSRRGAPSLDCESVYRRALFLQAPTCRVMSCFNFALYISWPLTNGAARLFYDYSIPRHDKSLNNHVMVHDEISHWAAVIGYLQYGTFCYLIYILRMSTQWELSMVTHFVCKHAPTANVDICRDRIAEAHADFRVLRHLVALWMAFTMTVATWGITAHFTWNYAIYTICHFTEEGAKYILLLNMLIWSQKIMFFVLPYVALGGLNLQYLWQYLRYNLSRMRREVQDNHFWSPILQYTKEINFSVRALGPTIIFSIVGLFFGLQLHSSNQNLDFWNGPSDYKRDWGVCDNITLNDCVSL